MTFKVGDILMTKHLVKISKEFSKFKYNFRIIKEIDKDDITTLLPTGYVIHLQSLYYNYYLFQTILNEEL